MNEGETAYETYKRLVHENLETPEPHANLFEYKFDKIYVAESGYVNNILSLLSKKLIKEWKIPLFLFIFTINIYLINKVSFLLFVPYNVEESFTSCCHNLQNEGKRKL